jgi:uncharacterized protein YecT (DUF1311 family)
MAAMKTISFVIGLLLISTAALRAQQTECDMDHGMVEYGNCLDRQVVAVDSELNQTYKKALASLAPDQQQALRRAERAWIRYRDAKLAQSGSLTSGGNHPSEFDAENVIALERERIVFLRKLISTHKFSYTPNGAFLAAMRNDLQNLAVAEEGYWVSHHTYVRNLSLLDFHSSKGVTVSVREAAPDGWSGVATHSTLGDAKCTVFFQNVTPIPPATIEGEIACD